MIAWLAVCVNTADIWQAAHIVALAVDAGFLVGAVVVVATALCKRSETAASHVRTGRSVAQCVRLAACVRVHVCLPTCAM